MTGFRPPRRVLVTGAGGNLGRKLIAALLHRPWCEEVVGVDREPMLPEAVDPRLRPVVADLADGLDPRWREAMEGCDAVVHLAARNPAPNAPWADACASYDMTANVVLRALQTGVRRLVFASSNHVMGRYKDPPLANGLKPGALSTALPPGPGTRWHDGREFVDAVAYAASKLLGERLCVAAAAGSGGALTTVSVRIGWCQPGENRPETISAAESSRGEPPAGQGPEAERDGRWFRAMWLSNRDFAALMERALLADAAGWPSPGVVVNGMSRNRGMPWDLDTTRAFVGYEPQDDIRDHLPGEEAPLDPAEFHES